MITETLADAHVEIEEYVKSGWYGAPDDAFHEALAHLLGHMDAVCTYLDDNPDDAKLAEIAAEFGTVSSERMTRYVELVDERAYTIPFVAGVF